MLTSNSLGTEIGQERSYHSRLCVPAADCRLQWASISSGIAPRRSTPYGGERMPITWHGTHDEGLELLTAVVRNCTCVFDVKDARVSLCEAHVLLIQHQRVLNGLSAMSSKRKNRLRVNRNHDCARV